MSTYDDILARSGLVSAGMIPTKYVPGIIQEAVTQSITMKLMKKLPNMPTAIESMPVMNLFPQAYWVDTEAGDGGGSEFTEGLMETGIQGWTNTTITAAKMGVVVPIPKDTIDDAVSNGYDLWGEIKPRLAESIARKFDLAVLFGTNKPSAFPDSILTDAGTASMVIDRSDSVGSGKTFVDLYDAIMAENGLLSLVENKRFMPDGIVADISMKAAFRGLRSADGVPLWAGEKNGLGGVSYTLDGLPVDFAENMVSTSALIIAGAWKRAMYAWRSDIAITFSDSGMVTDGSGAVLLNAFQQDVILMKATCRIGWCCPIPADIAGTATRYPFAVLKP
jgi:HK97 family phage major capsid protein